MKFQMSAQKYLPASSGKHWVPLANWGMGSATGMATEKADNRSAPSVARMMEGIFAVRSFVVWSGVGSWN